MTLDLIAAFAAGYLLGGVPSAALAARLRGRDIFRTGSGNMGAMNAARHLGWSWGAAVLAVDAGKGAGATLLGGWMGDLAGLQGDALAHAAGVAAVVGHAWSPYVGFRGGKALATSFGVALPLYPMAAVYTVLLLLALVLLLRRADLASLLALGAYPVVTALVLEDAGWPRERVFATVTAVALIAAVSATRHLLAWRSRRDPDPPVE